MADRDTYKYHFIRDRKVVHRGITDDLKRREQEHERTYRGGHIKQIGVRTTEEGAREWEKKGGKR